jgi:nucleoside-diphosphate-sugar epimerase
MASVAVTGSSGKLGRAVVAHLRESGWDVLALDRHASPQDQHSTAVDLTDFGHAVGALTGVDSRASALDAVVHLAAIPAPGLLTNAVTFANNMVASYNVFTAAILAGVRKIVWASSETVLGLPLDDEPPPYVPVDEDYAPRPNSTYSLGKTLEEELARQLCRWHPDLSMIGLRFSNVMEPQDYSAFPSFDADPRARSWNLWSYIDARDGAQAVRLALEHEALGADVYIIANDDTVMTRPNEELLAQVLPGVQVRRPFAANETLLSIDKAKRVLGYRPQYSWRDQIQPR